MRVAVLNTSVPFVRGGAEHLADSLVGELEVRGHEVELVKVPLRWSCPDDVAESMFAAACLRVPAAERVIALKFPAYLVPHDNKVVWLLHQFRQVYDLAGTDLQDFPSTAGFERLGRAIRAADGLAFSEARAVFCNSAVTAERLLRFNGVDASVMLAPHGDPEMFRRGEFGGYLLAIGRINAAKRQRLLIEAMSSVRSDLRLVVAGEPETAQDLQSLRDAIDFHRLGSRVELIPRFVSDQEKVKLLADATAVAYIPVDEDSYGYVTAEAMMSAKPVLTASDSGGVLELVEHAVTGAVASPTPHDISGAVDFLADAAVAAKLGAAAYERVQSLGLSWDRTIERLLA
jgi:glycosyltransferase involved in cell wall biosynthesis